MFNVTWLVPGRVILFQGVGDQTLESLDAAVADLTRLLENGEAPVHVVSDSRYVGRFPTNLKAMGAFLAPHENAGITITVGGNAMIKFTSKMLARLSGSDNLVFKETIADALAHLQAYDTSLPAEIPFSEEPAG